MLNTNDRLETPYAFFLRTLKITLYVCYGVENIKFFLAIFK